jgi:glycosyltransferase involved in cell wall biosynthesis
MVASMPMHRPARSLRRLAGLTRHELTTLRALRAEHGLHDAAALRIRKHLDMEAVSSPWATEAGNQLSVLGPAVAGLEDARDLLGHGHDVLVERTEQLARADHQHGLRLAGLESLEAEARTTRDVLAMTAFVSQLPQQDLRVSVITTTRGRPDALRHAIESVLAQSHHAWQLVIAHDAAEAATAEVIASFEDPRIVAVDRRGAARAAALNHGLEHATGDVIAYLDDDNTMLPHWLAALAWVFSEEPGVQVAYGALARQVEGDAVPLLQLESWDPLRLEHENLIDQNALAHRRGLPEACFDEELTSLQDWELLVRLTADATPRRIPVLACAYRTGAPNRLTEVDGKLAIARRIKRQAAARRPLRVLGSNAMFPLISETYISDELESLVDNGAQLAYYREAAGVAPMEVPRQVYDDFDLAVAEFRPDVVMMHWAHYAQSQLPRMEAHELPFGVRVHSFDFSEEIIRALMLHPLCAGVWTYPSERYSVEGTQALPPVFTSVRDMPAPAAVREAVVSISAGLPKKDWPLLFDAFGRLSGMARHVVTGVTAGHTHVPGELATRAAEMADPVLVQVNLTRGEALGLLARASVLVYSLVPEQAFGMPMSVVEGLCAGCCVILPDRPECRDYAGPGFRGYRTADDIVRHVEQVRRGGPEIEAERAANMAYGRERFCDPQLGADFFAQLRRGTDQVRYGRLEAGLSAATSLA